jgi:Kef-type K+ transport system membrane component KefB
MDRIEFPRTHAVTMPTLAKFVIGLALVIGMPVLSRLVRLLSILGLLLAGVVIGPHVLDVLGQNRPIAAFFADLGKLLLMFFAGLEIDPARFPRRSAEPRSSAC